AGFDATASIAGDDHETALTVFRRAPAGGRSLRSGGRRGGLGLDGEHLPSGGRVPVRGVALDEEAERRLGGGAVSPLFEVLREVPEGIPCRVFAAELGIGRAAALQRRVTQRERGDEPCREDA